MTKQEAPNAAIKKIDWAEQFINQHLQAFRCPYCHEAMVSAENHSVVCEKGHRFNISKKGTLHLMKQNANTDYDAPLFHHRYELAQSGFFEPLLEAILPHLSADEEKCIVDIGCGEGYYSRKLQEAYPEATFYAFDLSKESVQLAAKSDASWKVNWFVGDLAHLPIQSKSMEVILDIFSPANYAEFERVLKAEGVIIKVVPTSSHLKEIRQLAQDQLTKQSYSNQEILEHFEDHCQILSSETVSLTKSLTPEERQALLAMTPLLFHVDQEKIDWTQLTEITIEAKLLVGKIKTQRT